MTTVGRARPVPAQRPHPRRVLRPPRTAGTGRLTSPLMTHTHVTPAAASRNRLGIVFGITLAVFLFELVGGIAANSLALIADAGHLLTDLAGIGLALVAIWFAGRPANRDRSYGLMRLEILAAVVNAMLLFAVAAYVLVEAWRRWNSPPEIEAGLMLVVAVVGLVANGDLARGPARRPAREPADARRLPRGHGRPRRLGGGHRGRPRDRATGWLRADAIASVAHRPADPAADVDAAQGRGRRAARGVAEGHRPRRGPVAHPRGAGGGRRPRPPRLDDHVRDERRLGARRPRRVRAPAGRPRLPLRLPVGRLRHRALDSSWRRPDRGRNSVWTICRPFSARALRRLAILARLGSSCSSPTPDTTARSSGIIPSCSNGSRSGRAHAWPNSPTGRIRAEMHS